jgi:FtsP/CotA-like multicopper oxidase with cupredoxin domain
MGGLVTIVVGTKMPWIMNNPAYAAAQVQTLNFTITDAIKEMVTHEPGNNEATCYFWIYQANVPNFPPECPGPTIFCTVGDTIEISITNTLDEPHAFFINQVFDSGPIAPNATVTATFQPSRAGTYLYYDNLNEPVNRVMGLHGAFIVMPPNLQGTRKLGAHRMTPYDLPTPTVQLLFDDLGTAPWWPGLAWEQGDPELFSYAQPSGSISG